MKLIELFEKRNFPHTRMNNILDDEEILTWCKENASEYLSNPTPIYRGAGAGTTAIYHTNQFERASKNTFNYYTQWMDNHPDWKAYPKRSKSLICTTSMDVAAGYHQQIFHVIPSNACKIGVVPAHDLWYSFEPLRDYLYMSGGSRITTSSMDNMVSALRSLFGLLGVDGDHDDEDKEYDYGDSTLETSWPALKGALKEVTYDLILDNVSEHRGDWELPRLRALKYTREEDEARWL